MKKIIITLIALLIAAAGYYTLSPLFIDKAVNDELEPDLVALIEQTETINSETATSTGKSTVRGPFPIVDTRLHPATGEVRVIQTSDETIVRFENYDGTNGPDLYVYLAKDLEAEDFISLGRAKGNQGNINYAVPEGVSIDDYQYVMTWCQQFGVLFDYATLQ